MTGIRGCGEGAVSGGRISFHIQRIKYVGQLLEFWRTKTLQVNSSTNSYKFTIANSASRFPVPAGGIANQLPEALRNGMQTSTVLAIFLALGAEMRLLGAVKDSGFGLQLPGFL